MKVIVAMSGGVDSSVAAYLLKKQGFDVTGLSFELWDRRDLPDSNVCCSVETIALAKSVALRLGIEHYTVDVRDAFYSHVIESFCEAYIGGETPNPCILCNKYIKFAFLMEKVREFGADFIATGHYARAKKPEHRTQNLPTGQAGTEHRLVGASRWLAHANSGQDETTRHLLLKGIDLKKDQSYVLYVMKQEELARTLFPLGELTKEMTRAIAKELNLATALRPESQEICFVGKENYADFIRGFSPASLNPGPVVGIEGNVVAEHKGIAFYTIGQRKRLGISSLKPHYVVRIDRGKNAVVVGSREEAMKKNIKVKDLNWIAIDSLSAPLRVNAKVRSTMREVAATISPETDGRVFVEFDEPQWAPAPGQSAVFYEADKVLGGGIIEQN